MFYNSIYHYTQRCIGKSLFFLQLNMLIVVHIVLMITAIKLLRLQIFRITQVISNTILEIF